MRKLEYQQISFKRATGGFGLGQPNERGYSPAEEGREQIYIEKPYGNRLHHG